MAFIAAMALGGAAIGALANKKDRKKGALMGLGLGLLGPLAAGAGAAGAGTAGAGAAALAPVSVGSVVPASAMVATPAAAGTIGTGVGGTGAAATTTLGKIGSALTGETAKELALATAPVALQAAMTPGQQQQAPAGRSLALQNQQGERISPYQRAALNRQQRMKGQGQQGPKRFVN